MLFGFFTITIYTIIDFYMYNGSLSINLLFLQTLSEKNKISREMKKTTHTTGTKSYARWSEDMVSHLLFKKFIHDSSYFLFTFPETS